MKKSFYGKVDISEYNAPKPVYCAYDGELTQDAKYVNGIYTYTYNISSTGPYWSVVLSDKTSIDAVTEVPCTYINEVPITSMSPMFYNSKASTIDVSGFDTTNITSIDLSNFNTSNVTNMNSMIYGCQKLKTIYVGNNFTTDKITSSTSMFNYAFSLVGGAGTKYDSNHVDKEYARIDTADTPGYFTLKGN